MADFFLLAGIPGSGKSTIATDLAHRAEAVLISTDLLRQEITGRAEDRSRDGAVFGRALAGIESNLHKGVNVVYDATNLTARDRRRVLKVLPPGARRICLFIKIPLDEAMRRNEARERVVPQDVIRKMYAKLQEPTQGEGWDEIRIITDV